VDGDEQAQERRPPPAGELTCNVFEKDDRVFDGARNDVMQHAGCFHEGLWITAAQQVLPAGF
jgi:hypothetical protein